MTRIGCVDLRFCASFSGCRISHGPGTIEGGLHGAKTESRAGAVFCVDGMIAVVVMMSASYG